MSEAFAFVRTLAAEWSAWEALAVAFAIAYLVLAAREHIACWICAFVSTAIFTGLFWGAALPMQSALNVYYLVMAVYGWYAWRYGGTRHDGLAIRRLGVAGHVAVVAAIAALTVVSGHLLSAHVDSAWPYVDALTMWGGVITTVMVARKILENWIYWFVIDAISIPLYASQGLHLTALLFAVYVVLVTFGFREWHARLRAADAGDRHAAA